MPPTPSFDIVSRIDLQEVDNAVNNTLKQISQRYDFRDSKTEVNFDRKAKTITILAADKMKMDAVKGMLQAAASKRGIEIKALQFGESEPAAGSSLRRVVKLVEGLDKDIARKIVKTIKDAKLKVQSSIQGEEVRVSGKSIDDLQATIARVKAADIDIPLQFVNMK